MKNTVGFVFARGGSKSLPRKNIRILGGKPLIAHAIEVGKQSKKIDRILVSTDDPEIAKIATEFGAEVPFLRPKELAQDDTPEWLAWRHAIETLQAKEGMNSIGLFVSLPPTSPLRQPEDVDRCIQSFLEGKADVIITTTEAHRNPYFNMVQEDETGLVHLVAHSEKNLSRRQSAPQVSDMTTVAYVARPEFILKHNHIWEGRVRAVQIPLDRAVDIDTEWDFKWAEFILRALNEKGAR